MKKIIISVLFLLFLSNAYAIDVNKLNYKISGTAQFLFSKKWDRFYW